MYYLIIWALLFIVLSIYIAKVIWTYKEEKQEEVTEKRIWRKMALKLQKENARDKIIINHQSKSIKKWKRKFKKSQRNYD